MTAKTDTPAELRYLALAELIESPLNPRKHFDATKLRELADSIAKVGVLTPLVVRPSPGDRFEIGAGHRRFRAAKAAEIPTVPCRVLPLDDTAFLELLVTENGQRADVHPLEEADGYRSLMERAGYDVARIAERVGRSIPYVYDRLKLLQLTPAAKKLFLAGAFSTGHAVLLARLSPADQARAIDSDRSGNGRIGGLFVADFGEDDLALDDRDERATKPVSVREFAKWIDDQVRFEKGTPDPMLFPETAQAVQAATEQKEKVVAITHGHMVPPEAKDATERTYGAVSWKRADGQETRETFSGRKMKSRTCDRSVIGVVVVGHGRGEAFRVCVDKKCAVHWPAKKAEAAGGKKTADAAMEERNGNREDRWEKERRERQAAEDRWKKALPALKAEVEERVALLTSCGGGELATLLCREVGRGNKRKDPPKNAPPEDLVRHLALLVLDEAIEDWDAWQEFPKTAKALGVGVKNILDAAAPVLPTPKPSKPAPKKAAKAKGKKR